MSDPDTLHLEAFGKFLIEHLYDRGLQSYDAMLKNPQVSPFLQSQLQEKLAPWNSEQQEVVRICVSEAICNAIHDFLFALQIFGDAPDDEPQEDIVQIVIDGNDVAKLSGDFGLYGEFAADDGWVTRYSGYPNFNKYF